MIDERFSSNHFENLGIDSEESISLAKILRVEIEKELHETVLAKFSEILNQLNHMGHDLKLYEDIEPGSYAFRDDFIEKDDTYRCKLRVGLDYCVSTGYSEFKDWDDVLHEYDIDPEDN